MTLKMMQFLLFNHHVINYCFGDATSWSDAIKKYACFNSMIVILFAGKRKTMTKCLRLKKK